MNAKEKAKELLGRMLVYADTYEHASSCAIVCVNEIETALPRMDEVDAMVIEYWQDVRKELETL